MKLFKSMCWALAIGSFGACGVLSQERAASARGYGHSVALESGSASNLNAFFTTFDGAFNREPLFENIGGNRLYGRELSARSSSQNRYLSDYVFFSTNGALLEYGSIELSFPLGDGDQNGVPDSLQIDAPGNFSFSGAGQGDNPPMTFYTIVGTVNRPLNSATGEYQMRWQSGQGTINLQGQVRLTELTGSVNYLRGETNRMTFQLTYNGPDSPPARSLVGESTFTVSSIHQIQIAEFQLEDAQGNTITVPSFQMNRDQNQYLGLMTLSDGFVSTSWQDYPHHTLVITDTNDADEDLVPDLSDEFVPPPVIVAHPQSRAVPAGGSVTLRVQATDGNPIMYQWRFNNQILVGATQAELTINDFKQINVGTYDVRVSNFANTIVSEPAELTLARLPTITSQPEPKTVGVGSTVVFQVEADGTPPLSYQWFRNNIPLQGKTSSELVLENVQLNQSGNYRVEVSNAVGKAVSDTVALEVGSPPQIVQQPASQSVQAGESVVFSVTVSGEGPFEFQWRRDGSPLEGRTQSQLSIAAATPADSGRYSVVVSNSAGSVASADATLTVTQTLLTGAFNDQGGFILTLNGQTGANYRVDWSADLNEWTELTSFSNVNGPVTFEDAGAAGRSMRFYRAVGF